MPRSIYAWELEATDCSVCSAPVIAELGIGVAKCERCGGEARIPSRPREPSVPPSVDEASRVAALFAQLEEFDPKGPLVPWIPADLQRFETMTAQPEHRSAGLAGLRAAWEEARASGDVSRFFRIGQALGRIYAEVDEHHRSRAVLESTLVYVDTREQRDMIRCRLARHALRAGDEDAHVAWLEECDPHPTRLEVDGEIRSTRALRAYKREDFSAVLDALGRSHTEVPLAFPIAPLGLTLRAHALAAVVDDEAAKNEIRYLVSHVPMGYLRAKQTFARHPGPASAYALAVARQASPSPTPKNQPPARPPAPPPRRWWWPFP